MFGVNGGEFILLALIAVFVLGPDRLPEYAAKLAHGIKKLRVMAEGAKDQLRDQLGPEYEDIDWRQYDPRQYDPRRIVREALLEPLDDAIAPVRDEIGSVRNAARIRGNGSGNGAAAIGTAAAGAAAAGTAGAVPGDGDQPAEDAAPKDEVGAVATKTPEDPRRRAWATPQSYDPARATPYDVEAT